MSHPVTVSHPRSISPLFAQLSGKIQGFDCFFDFIPDFCPDSPSVCLLDIHLQRVGIKNLRVKLDRSEGYHMCDTSARIEKKMRRKRKKEKCEYDN